MYFIVTIPTCGRQCQAIFNINPSTKQTCDLDEHLTRDADDIRHAYSRIVTGRFSRATRVARAHGDGIMSHAQVS